MLEGKTISGAEAVGGQIEVTAEDSKIVFGDGVNIRYLEAGIPIPKKHQLHIRFEDQSSIVCTVQMYGGIWAFKEGRKLMVGKINLTRAAVHGIKCKYI